MRFLNEDPWERLRTLRKHLPNTKLQMLFRGQNILGYKHYADDVVDAFCRKSVENGIDAGACRTKSPWSGDSSSREPGSSPAPVSY